MLSWFRRRWVCRKEHESMRASLETHIVLLEAALIRYETQLHPSGDLENISFALLERLKSKTCRISSR